MKLWEDLMKGLRARILGLGIVCFGLGLALTFHLIAAMNPDNNSTVMVSDHALVAALAKADNASTTKFLYGDFFWTNWAGETLTRDKFLRSLPKPPLGDERDTKVTEYTYDQVAEVRVDGGQTRILRVGVEIHSGRKL